jgi:DNA processing protein
VAYLGGVEAIFTESEKALKSVPGIDNRAMLILGGRKDALEKAKKEIDFITKNDIETAFYLDKNYPLRLRECTDAPLLLYTNSSTNLNPAKAISIVGTRRCTPYGTEMTLRFISYIAQYYPDTLIVSGLAYGIDIVAHRNALKNGLPTIGVLAHGLDIVYPSVHEKTALKMKGNGGLLTEFTSNTRPIPENFVKRNRIVAGMSDATIVIESAQRGGSVITASIASSYNREVFAVPGNFTEPLSVGCNRLIKSNKAGMIEGVSDLEYILGWSRDENKKRSQQTKLLIDLTDEEQLVFDYLEKEGKSHINPISIVCKLPMSRLMPILVNMEFNGFLSCYPGSMYLLK